MLKRGRFALEVVGEAAPVGRLDRQNRAVLVLAVPDEHPSDAGRTRDLDALAAVAPL